MTEQNPTPGEPGHRVVDIAPAVRETVEKLLRQFGEGTSARRNRPADYLRLVVPHLRRIKENRLNEVPPPLCVQLQVSSACSTDCRMCDHWKDRRAELGLAEWQAIFRDLAAFGVGTVIFSGGEPLVRPDIATLLSEAAERGLGIGLLTNGTMPAERTDAERVAVFDAVARHVRWVAISVDGLEQEDNRIRMPHVKNRIEILRHFCASVRDRSRAVSLSATVTLQRENIGMNLQEACNFIQNSIGIPQVNFKLATGDTRALGRREDYLLSEESLKLLEGFLWNDHLPYEKGNNLAYLRRTFAQGIFSAADAAGGAPVHTFYKSKDIRCFTPFLFSLIDCDGNVYPCCHLYRDNHGSNRESKKIRNEHCAGNALKRTVDSAGNTVIAGCFQEVWNGRKYVEEREQLARIDPTRYLYSPCGECTRHCQHNAALSEIYSQVNDSLMNLPMILEHLRGAQGGLSAEDHVWF